jgi:hypothetical protein
MQWALCFPWVRNEQLGQPPGLLGKARSARGKALQKRLIISSSPHMSENESKPIISWQLLRLVILKAQLSFCGE